MISRLLPSLVVVLFGLAHVLVPIYVFPICEYADQADPADPAVPAPRASMGPSVRSVAATALPAPPEAAAMGGGAHDGRAAHDGRPDRPDHAAHAAAGVPAVPVAVGHAPAVPAPVSAGHVPAGQVGAGHDTGAHMVCWYTARAELGLGLAVILAGLALALLREPGERRGLYLGLAAMAATGPLFPTVLIGVCPGATMPCRTGTLPALVILGCALTIYALIAARLSAGRARRRRHA